MNGFGQDIDNKHPFPWKMPKFQPAAKTASTKAQLLDAVESSLKEFTAVVYGDHNDQKYSRLVDLIMLRFKSDLTGIPVTIQFSKDAIKDLVTQALNDAYDSNKSILKYDDAAKDIVSKLKLLANVNDNDSNAHEKTAYANTAKSNSKKQKVDDVVQLNDVASKQLQKLNDFICSMAIEVGKQFSKLEEMMMQHLAILSPDKYDSNVIETVERLKSLQLGPVAIDIKSQKKAAKHRQKSVDIIVAGMKFSSKMIDTLSTSAIKTVMHSAIAVKRHYDSLSTALCIIELYVKENLKYTTELVYDAFGGGGFLNWIKKFIGRIVNFAVDKLIKPLKTALYTIVIEPVKKHIIDWLLLQLPKCIKALNMVLQSFVAAAKLMWKGIRKTFAFVFKMLRKAFSKTLGWFVRGMKAAIRWLWKSLKWLVGKIIWAMRIAAKGILWGARLAGRILQYGWQQLKKSKFGRMIARGWKRLIRPFKTAKTYISNAFRAIKNKYVSIKNAIVDKVKTVGRKIKNFARTAINKTKNFAINIIKGIGNKFKRFGRSIGNYIGRMFNKIPGFKWLKTTVVRFAKFIGSKLFKKRAKQSLLNKLGKKIGSMIAKCLGRALAKGPGLLVALASLAWTMYQLFDAYQSLKTFFKPMISRLGYDTTSPAWFEKYLMENYKQLLDYVFNGGMQEFLGMVIDALVDEIFGTVREFTLLTVTADKRQELWENRWAIYNKYANGHFNITSKNLDSFLSKQMTRYKMIIHNAVQMRKYDDELYDIQLRFQTIPEQINECKQEIEKIAVISGMDGESYTAERHSKVLELQAQIDKLKLEEERAGDTMFSVFERRMETTADFLKYVMQSGMGVYHKKLIRQYAWNKWPEKDADTMLFLYQEAVTGLDYLNFLKYRDEINAKLQEQIEQYREFHATYHIDIDKLKTVFASMLNEQNNFTDNAQKFLEQIKHKRIEIQLEVDNVLEKYGFDSIASINPSDELQDITNEAMSVE